jgi:hypothetical protein
MTHQCPGTSSRNPHAVAPPAAAVAAPPVCADRLASYFSGTDHAVVLDVDAQAFLLFRNIRMKGLTGANCAPLFDTARGLCYSQRGFVSSCIGV